MPRSRSPEALLNDIRGGRAPAIVDVRSAAEYDAGHVPGAVNIPFHTVSGRAAEIGAAPDEPVVVYCQHGPRAWIAGAVLRRKGFRRVEYLQGHMHRWHALRLPEASARGQGDK
jgi:rhodanese-related sulfurtransferase